MLATAHFDFQRCESSLSDGYCRRAKGKGVAPATELLQITAKGEHVASMTSPTIPLEWILEYAVTEPSKFKDTFILGTSCRKYFSDNSAMRSTCINP